MKSKFYMIILVFSIVSVLSNSFSVASAADFTSTKAAKAVYDRCLTLLSNKFNQWEACRSIAGHTADRAGDLVSACQIRCKTDCPPTSYDTQGYYNCYNACADIYSRP